MRTGVLFYPELRNEDWPIIGGRLRNLPEVMEKQPALPGVECSEPEPAPEEALFPTHSVRYLIITRKDCFPDIAEFIFPRILEVLTS